ncbi:transglutaminase domain-containing protein [Edaphocola aurantiacus]|uniref:transglutaminase domain-containing protein n=1 Tax=Edaphocola aurantiacus TaxID=2601682 RepID=UPI001C93DE0C|nr:transglutaminase domain-containing protein [Edaphocola aurantiacus]
MKKILCCLLFCSGVLSYAAAQENNTSMPVANMFLAHKSEWSKTASVKELAAAIAAQTTDAEDQLRLLMLWMNNFLTVDEVKYNSGNYQPTGLDNIMKYRKAFGIDYAELTTAFCKELKIPCLNVLGYSKMKNYIAGSGFKEPNASWNLVKIKGQWYICDLFSSTQTMLNRSGFMSVLDTRYFMPDPARYITHAIPMDPAFQLLTNPISMQSYTNAGLDAIDKSIHSLNSVDYTAYAEQTMKLSPAARAMREAKAAYAYNPANPNTLIVTYYNQGVDLARNSKATNEQLKQAKSYLVKAKELLQANTALPEVQALKEPCIKGIQYLNTIIK